MLNLIILSSYILLLILIIIKFNCIKIKLKNLFTRYPSGAAAFYLFLLLMLYPLINIVLFIYLLDDFGCLFNKERK